VFRRSLTAVLVFACLGTLAPAALAARVHVRVEGKTQTIYGATEPVLDAQATAIDSLESASVAGEFYYHVKLFSFGPFVDQIGRYASAGSDGWVFKVNGASPDVAADKVTLKDGDTVIWYYATFGPSGGPLTLQLRKKGNCYRVFAQDSKGAEKRAPGAVLRFDGRRRKASFTATCIGSHRGLVRATAPGMIRSNALR
jgi:uncharacterized protein DUF4430